VCDRICGAGFLGNFYDTGPNSIELTARGLTGRQSAHSFTNAEAAFQALKFWDAAAEFEHLSGDQAFQQKKALRGGEDFEYAGFGSNWKGMWAVLQRKFALGTPMSQALALTGDAYLLEHNTAVGRDGVWSDNFDGEGKNWLGMQLMLVRDLLRGRHAWTRYIEQLVDTDTGEPHDSLADSRWQDTVRKANRALLDALGQAPPPAPSRQARSAARLQPAETPHPAPEAPAIPKFRPRPGQIVIRDPRGSPSTLGLIAFSHSETEEPWDQRCGSIFLGNHYELGAGALQLEVADNSWFAFCGYPSATTKRFRNAEAAFHALKYWKLGRADEFGVMTASEAISRNEQLKYQRDKSFAGIGSAWPAMRHVLRAKFRPGTDIAIGLLKTDQDFLLQYSYDIEDDAVCPNELGLQLMLVRDELRSTHPTTPGATGSEAGEWTAFVSKLINLQTGKPHGPEHARFWQDVVQSATRAVRETLVVTGRAGGGDAPGTEGRNCRSCTDPEACSVQ